MTRLLLADGWHDIEQWTFELDGHSFGFAELVSVEGAHGELTATGRFITGPLTSVLAVESQPKHSGNVPGQPVRPPPWP
ncbi:hypothetical protein PHK61_23775 [Actinomycetospora lutea]|uniref:hypothetical protein n=1 Tax=Actinomycetospora lutea TaxID=663604 RepID=UPI0023650181|nr:hypothetical protein [Actinomycetospora lutea]MDD7941446.1 hypothetical protein [Actinomycetospora lutea]